ncbi:flagellar protein FlgN [Saccharophagus sp. K07]|nr:flagellar export chaperone FlgN [Saccharophagus sp. K07]MBC6905075.1 flagellar protein FlgN [Saccharophagus sp. K07]
MQDLYQQLLERNSAAIERINAQINLVLEEVRARTERRSKILAAFGLGTGAEAMKQAFLLFSDSRRKALQQQWQELAELVKQAKQLNERNGKLLAMHNDILNQLLAADRDPQVYTPQYL